MGKNSQINFLPPNMPPDKAKIPDYQFYRPMKTTPEGVWLAIEKYKTLFMF